MMRWLLALTVPAILLGGCSSTPVLTGTWKGTAHSRDFIQIFGPGDRFQGIVLARFGSATINITIEGTYKLKGNELETNPTDVVVTGMKPEDNTKTAEQIKKEGGLKPTKGTVKFLGPDEMTLTRANIKVDLKRQKDWKASS